MRRSYGGNADDSISLLLNDVELWKRRGYLLQGEKKKAHTNNVVSIVVATALCAGTLYVLNALPGILNMEAPYNVLQQVWYRSHLLGFFLWMIYVYARSEKTLTRNWLKEEGGRDEEYVLRSYEKAMNYDEKKEMKKHVVGGSFFRGSDILLQQKNPGLQYRFFLLQP